MGIDLTLRRQKTKARIRGRVSGTAERPRLTVFRSLNQIYAQIVDDNSGKTLASASSNDKGVKLSNGGNVEAATQIGTLIAQRALAAGITKVVFDRNGYLYHGRVKALADGARLAGLNF